MTIIKIAPEGTKVKKGEIICELDSAALRDTPGQPAHHHRERQGQFPERQAHPRGGRDRRHRIQGRHFRPGPRHRRGRDQAGRVRHDPIGRPARVGQADVREGLRLDGPEGLGRADLQEGPVHPRASPEQAERSGSSTRNRRRSRNWRARSKRPAPTSWPNRQPGNWRRPRRRSWRSRSPPARSWPRSMAWSSTSMIPARGFGSTQPQIEEGASVRERQKIISIPDITPDAGQRQGPRVADRQDHPEHEGHHPRRCLRRPGAQRHGPGCRPPARSGNFFSSDIKVYTTHIRIDNPLRASGQA